MSTFWIIIILILVISVVFSSPACEHEWVNRSTPYKLPGLWSRGGRRSYHQCTKCGKTEDCDRGFNMPTEHDNPAYRCTKCGAEHDN